MRVGAGCASLHLVWCDLDMNQRINIEETHEFTNEKVK